MGPAECSLGLKPRVARLSVLAGLKTRSPGLKVRGWHRGSVVKGPAVSPPVQRSEFVRSLRAQPFQAEERRDQSVDVFETVVNRQRRADRGFHAEPA